MPGDSQLIQPFTPAWKESGGGPGTGSAPDETASPQHQEWTLCNPSNFHSPPSPPPQPNHHWLSGANRSNLMSLTPVTSVFKMDFQTISSTRGIPLPMHFDRQWGCMSPFLSPPFIFLHSIYSQIKYCVFY